MARGYRAIVELNSREGALQTADRLFHEWVNKKYPPGGSRAGVECDAEGIYRFGELTSKWDETADVVATKLSEASEDRHYERQLLEMVERRKGGDQWTTRVYALHATKESRYRDVLWVEVTPPREGVWDAKPPALVRDLITEGHCHDRGMPLSDSPQSVADEEQVEQLIGWIRDERRRASVVVAAPLTDGSDLGSLEAECRWKDILRSLTKNSLGCASYFLLTPEAYRQFHARIGQGCAMPKGSLRTYLPGFRADEPTDRLRHRVLTAGTLLRGYDEKNKQFRPELSAIIARTPCEYLWENGLDKELRRAQAPLDKKRLSVPTFHPLRESERTVELLDEKVRQRVAESFSAAASDSGGPVEDARLPAREEQEEAPLRTSAREVDVRPATSEPAPQRGQSQHLAWYEPLRRLIRRFLPAFNPRSHTELESGVAALESGLDAMNDAHAQLAHKRDALADELRVAEELLEEASHQSREIEELKEEKKAIAEQLLASQQERERLSKRNRSLEWKLRQEESIGRATEPDDSWLADAPKSMSELFDRMTQQGYETVTRYVELSAPDSMVDDILAIDDLAENHYASEFWNYILVLRDYMRARETGDFTNGDLDLYLACPPEGYFRCGPGHHKRNEGRTVKTDRKMRLERMLPVPTEVDSRGYIEMWTHFAPAFCNQKAPRMYYYADTKKTNKVYIGYIGYHPTNTKTN
jgi:hypothetical protein